MHFINLYTLLIRKLNHLYPFFNHKYWLLFRTGNRSLLTLISSSCWVRTQTGVLCCRVTFKKLAHAYGGDFSTHQQKVSAENRKLKYFKLIYANINASHSTMCLAVRWFFFFKLISRNSEGNQGFTVTSRWTEIPNNRTRCFTTAVMCLMPLGSIDTHFFIPNWGRSTVLF